MNLSPNTKLIKKSLFGNVIKNDIGVNEEGLTIVTPSSFSTKIRKQKYIYLMKMVPTLQLPSFRLGIMEVVTAVAQAAVASNLVFIIFQLKKVFLLLVDIFSITPGWNNFYNTTFNTALSQPAIIDRMAYGNKFVTKHLQTIFERNEIKT